MPPARNGDPHSPASRGGTNCGSWQGGWARVQGWDSTAGASSSEGPRAPDVEDPTPRFELKSHTIEAPARGHVALRRRERDGDSTSPWSFSRGFPSRGSRRPAPGRGDPLDPCVAAKGLDALLTSTTADPSRERTLRNWMGRPPLRGGARRRGPRRRGGLLDRTPGKLPTLPREGSRGALRRPARTQLTANAFYMPREATGASPLTSVGDIYRQRLLYTSWREGPLRTRRGHVRRQGPAPLHA